MAQNADESDDEVIVTGGETRRQQPHPLPLGLRTLAKASAAQLRSISDRSGSVAKSPSGERNHGPVIIVAIVGDPHGRWGTEFECESDLGAFARQLLNRAWATAEEDAMHVPFSSRLMKTASDGQLPMCFGYAIVRSWTLSAGTPANQQTQVMMNLLAHNYRRSCGLDFLEHPFLAGALVDKPFVVNSACAQAAQHDATALCIEQTGHSTFAVRQANDTELSLVNSFESLMDHWQHLFDFDRRKVYVWPMSWTLAQMAVRGHWTIDVTPIVPRMSLPIWTPPIQPPRQLMRTIRNRRVIRHVDCNVASESSHGPASGSASTVAPTTACKPFSAEHRIRALVAAQHLKSQQKAAQTVDDTLGMVFAENPEMLTKVRDIAFKVPEKTSLQRARPRFDIAAMLANRELYKRTGPFFRYIASDASPQRSEAIEIFSSVERVVMRSAIFNKDIGSVSPGDIRHRKLPLATLGQGKTDLNSKVIAQVIGPSISQCQS